MSMFKHNSLKHCGLKTPISKNIETIFVPQKPKWLLALSKQSKESAFHGKDLLLILLTEIRYLLMKKSSNILSKKKLLKGELNLEEKNKRDKGRKEERVLKKRLKKEKKARKIEQRPPIVGGCFHVCETLIFEVYKLLGGSLCDCVK